MKPRRQLATSGHRWGLSCEVENEAQMGVILGYMRLFGATNIGFDAITSSGGKGKPDPVRSEAAKRAATKRLKNHSRKPLETAAKDWLSKLKQPQFAVVDFKKALDAEGWRGDGPAYRVLKTLMDNRLIKRKDQGIYIRLPALVKEAS